MLRKLVVTAFFGALFAVPCLAQMPWPSQADTQQISGDEVLDRLLRSNSLTHDGKPVHAVMEIAEEKGDPAYSGRLEVFWADEHRYKLTLHSRDFDQTLVVNGDQAEEDNRGDFYPNWLRGFATALLDPVPRVSDLRGHARTVAIGPHVSYSCIKRDDRPGGITDERTWASVCFGGDAPTLQFAMDFMYNMEFHDFRKFGRKSIARKYISGEGDHARIDGTLITLEELKHVDDSMFGIAHPTPAADRLLTSFVSTKEEEAMTDHKPVEVHWPSVREGKLDGYMIVQAVTDRSGQVRETSKHNSDNAELESAGREIALGYHFHPLTVDGAPRQMLMPLVLHFTAAQSKPYPLMDDAWARANARHCSLPKTVDMPNAAGKQLTSTLRIGTDGTVHEFHGGLFPLAQATRSCHFPPQMLDGQPTPFDVQLTVTAR